MNEKCSKNAKVEKFTNILGIAVRLNVIDPLGNGHVFLLEHSTNGWNIVDLDNQGQSCAS